MSAPGMGEALSSIGRGVARATREAVRGAQRRPLLPLASFGTLCVCLLLVGLFGLGAWNVHRLTATWGGGGHLTVYLDDEASTARAAQLLEAARRLPGVVDATLVTPGEAHRRLRAALGGRGALIDGVDEGFLPASIDVRLRPGVAGLLRAHPSFQRLSTAAGVEELDLHAETQERLDRLRQLAVRGAVGLGALLLLATIYLVAATIRLGVEARRDELAVLRLVGGTERFVRAPFLLEGLVSGALGAAAALLLLWTIIDSAGPRVAAALGGWVAAAPLTFFPPPVCAAMIVAGALLGLLGARAAFVQEAA